jgi:glycosyltransferase involved in cell wall biosynthesis
VDPAVRVIDAGAPLRLDRSLASLATERRIDIVHVHGLWAPPIHAACESARRLGLPLVLATHGMLEPSALAIKWWKKRAALAVYQRRGLAAADILHATALQEAGNLRRFGLRQPILVAPPGITPPRVESMRDWQDSAPRTALFVGRIAPVKNLLGLIAAWADARPAGWKLVIAGPDDAGHAAAIQAAIDRAGLAGSVGMLGPQYGAAKEALFRSASLFVLPSLSENFGVVVLEALAYGVPVVATCGTPWQEVADTGAGWWVPGVHGSLAATLAEATRASPDELCDMGQRGRRLVEERYAWPAIRDGVQAAYDWILGCGSRPACVLT